MDAVNCIKTRRSIRKFEDRPVSEELIKEIVEITSYSPSWKNSQTSKFIAVFDKDLKSKIAEEGVMGFTKNTNNINGAPVLMVEVTENGKCGFEADGRFSTSKETHWQSFDSGIFAQSFSLACHEKGLGSVILGIYDEAKVKEILGLKDNELVSSLIPVGYPLEIPEKAPTRKSVDELLTIR